MSFTSAPASWDLNILVHQLWTFLMLVSWWNPCLCAHTGRASPATAAFMRVTALADPAVGSAPLPQGQGCQLGPPSCCGWHGRAQTWSVAIVLCRHIWESPCCGNVACCTQDGCVQDLSKQKNAELASTSCTLTRPEIPALVNPVVITKSCELLWIPAADSSISAQSLI